jgi:hypothetical protein
MDEYFFISFDTTTRAMQAEDTLKGLGVKNTIIPTPREVTVSCGLSIKLDPSAIEVVRDLVQDGRLIIKGIYHLKKQGDGRAVEKIG